MRHDPSMRTARPVGLTDDGRFVIVETADGESISVPADELRPALRNRPRRHLETELEQSMTPREIQMKIRAGASVEEIVEASGMPVARVEAFAAPVLAERNHIAGLAQTGSVRRTGESTGHRTLRAALAERLKARGVNPDTVEWDSFKMDDGRWSVNASYRIEQAERCAVFYFDQRGRFSVPGNDEGRWAIGEPTEADAPTTPSVGEDVDTEPTLKLAGPADELALLRAVEIDEAAPEPDAEEPATAPEGTAEDGPSSAVEIRTEEEFRAEIEMVAVPDDAPDAEAEVPAEPSQLDLLYDLLGSDGYAEDSIRVFEGLSDAAAVPDVADTAWQEPEPEPEDEPAAESGQPRIFADGATQETLPGAEHGTAPESIAESAPETLPETEQESVPETEPESESQDSTDLRSEPMSEPDSVPRPESEPEPKPAAKAKRRKRASVPSWDEIMFGSPGPKGK
ncbi:septation protein SepH [Microlunatus sp. Gsoil 973]|uniref:septation protein SepH n=1 Tax=Microlunatus sp. Gsoil 973 TaxID=2672569 RepID=UPI0012B4C20E|nr:septation protein SepH [Microlunatus sp. Gsoil 973]QGN32949.1 DUF3071 domain-containing protein [Microlunatus sp. Gsoil 973]